MDAGASGALCETNEYSLKIRERIRDFRIFPLLCT